MPRECVALSGARVARSSGPADAESAMTPSRDWARGTDLKRTGSGVLLGGGLLVLSLAVVGFADVQRALWRVPPRRMFSLLAVGVVPLFVWGTGLRLVFETLGHSLRLRHAVLLFTASSFLNAVTPFGQVGGDPPAAVLFSRTVGTDFETSLAAIGSLNALNRVAAVVLGLFGVGFLGARVAGGDALRRVAVVAAGLSVGVVVGLALGWRYRFRLVSLLGAVLTPLFRGVERVLPRVTLPSRDAVERRGVRFVDALDRLAAAPRRLAVVFGLSLAGHLAVAVTLWVALATLGVRASLTVTLLLIPLAKLGGVAPTPGGVGSSTALLTALVVSATAVTPALAGAAVLLYRASAFWLPALAGGFVTGWFWVVGPERVDATRSRPASVSSPLSPSVPRLLLALAVSLAVLVTVALHRSHLVVEPDSVVVHLIRDASLVVLSFALTWAVVRRLPRGWFG